MKVCSTYLTTSEETFIDNTVSQVYLSAIAGYLPSAIVQCISAFLDACYIARRNAITGPMLERFEECVQRFHSLREVFIATGVRETISLPRQHALSHFRLLIALFGAPNGLCSSITESRHVKAVKKTWRRSSRYKALQQMLRTISRLENMAVARLKFTENGMMVGSTSEYTLYTVNQTHLNDHGTSTSDEDASNLDTIDVSSAMSFSFPAADEVKERGGDSDLDTDTDNASNASDTCSELSESENDEDACDIVPVDDVVQDESLFEVKVSDRPGEC
jgi:hypothetical protein